MSRHRRQRIKRWNRAASVAKASEHYDYGVRKWENTGRIDPVGVCSQIVRLLLTVKFRDK
jgi:hypothetical protein